MNRNNQVELDYSSLIKLIPIGLGISVFANAFIQTTIADLHIHIAFLLIFTLITLDSILEFGRYDYSKLPKSLKIISFLNGFILIALIISISFYSNQYLKDKAISLIFITLALSSLTEFSFSLILGKALKKQTISDTTMIDYDVKDTNIYCIWEVLFLLIYLFLSVGKFTSLLNIDFIIPWIGLFTLLIEIFVFNYFKSN